jgi:uncharacterized protein (DUF427 family)
MSTRVADLFGRGADVLRHEPIERRVRAYAGDRAVVDSTRALLVWEPRRIVPCFAVPEPDIRAELSRAPAAGGEVAGALHPGIPFSVHTAEGEPLTIGDRVGAGFRLADEDLAGYVALDFDAFDRWLEEDEEIAGHPRDPFHRVDVRLTERPVRIEAGGETLAETTRARLVFETGLPTRFYVTREDVRAELRPSERRTSCPYKGEASYWSFDAGDDLAWSYEQPLPDMLPLKGLVAFWDERVDVFLDGARRGRPTGIFAEVLREEFGV